MLAHLHKIHRFFVPFSLSLAFSLLLHHRMAFFNHVRHFSKCYCCCTFSFGCISFHSVFPFSSSLFSTLVLHKYYSYLRRMHTIFQNELKLRGGTETRSLVLSPSTMLHTLKSIIGIGIGIGNHNRN